MLGLYCSAHLEAILMFGVLFYSPGPILLWVLFCSPWSRFFHFYQLWCWECSSVPLGQLCSDIFCFGLFVIYLTSEKIFLFCLTLWSNSDVGSVLLCPWASCDLCYVSFFDHSLRLISYGSDYWIWCIYFLQVGWHKCSYLVEIQIMAGRWKRTGILWSWNQSKV